MQRGIFSAKSTTSGCHSGFIEPYLHFCIFSLYCHKKIDQANKWNYIFIFIIYFAGSRECVSTKASFMLWQRLETTNTQFHILPRDSAWIHPHLFALIVSSLNRIVDNENKMLYSCMSVNQFSSLSGFISVTKFKKRFITHIRIYAYFWWFAVNEKTMSQKLRILRYID